jgi:hypothetical protein
MKQHIYCFAHMQMAEARVLMLRLPLPEDANSIQVGLMRIQIQKAVIEGTISMKKAGSVPDLSAWKSEGHWASRLNL